jgi:hypothetical protein
MRLEVVPITAPATLMPQMDDPERCKQNSSPRPPSLSFKNRGSRTFAQHRTVTSLAH